MARTSMRTLGAGLVLAAALVAPTRGVAAEPTSAPTPAPATDQSAQWDGVVAPTPPPPPSEPPAPRIEEPAGYVDERDVLRNDPEIAPRYRRGRGMVIGGAVLLGTGLGILSVAGLIALVESGSSFGYSASTPMALTGAIIGVGGGSLLGVGIVRRRDARRDAQAKLALAPGGLTLRF